MKPNQRAQVEVDDVIRKAWTDPESLRNAVHDWDVAQLQRAIGKIEAYYRNQNAMPLFPQEWGVALLKNELVDRKRHQSPPSQKNDPTSASEAVSVAKINAKAVILAALIGLPASFVGGFKCSSTPQIKADKVFLTGVQLGVALEASTNKANSRAGMKVKNALLEALEADAFSENVLSVLRRADEYPTEANIVSARDVASSHLKSVP
jgi:hypothetical protein